ncbi:hypothetical protein, conserved [Plasmodium gonderi]|uniref:Uncharacterized protein n=1 Tax=Plasmodium gonderi TaxID=77519 RepID=A0A1Y1JLT0_PLAGO|nr:hypothetical protein, conserved [Plasmodium gonderi]GAW82588.1 hypothetical protein, conserved [Plasmodium gonderi]
MNAMMEDKRNEFSFENEEFEDVEHAYDNFNSEVHVHMGLNGENESDVMIDDFSSSGSECSGSWESLNKDDCDNENSDTDRKSENDGVGDNDEMSEGKKKKKKKGESKKGKKDNDIKLAVKIALQVLLKNQPFPVKREELFSAIIMYVPNCNNNTKKKKLILKLLKKKVKNILALNLLTLNSKTKTEYVLTQNITYKKHNDFLFSNLDHNIRGFLIFLIPFFKVFHNKIPLSYLLYELSNIGYKSLKTKEEIVKILNSPNVFTSIVNHIIMSKQLVDPLDYLIYSKKLSYIDFSNNHQYDENSMDGFYCIPTARFEKEINIRHYILDIMNVPNKKFQLKDMYVLFEEKYFLDLNYDNL